MQVSEAEPSRTKNTSSLGRLCWMKVLVGFLEREWPLWLPGTSEPGYPVCPCLSLPDDKNQNHKEEATYYLKEAYIISSNILASWRE